MILACIIIWFVLTVGMLTFAFATYHPKCNTLDGKKREQR